MREAEHIVVAEVNLRRVGIKNRNSPARALNFQIFSFHLLQQKPECKKAFCASVKLFYLYADLLGLCTQKVFNTYNLLNLISGYFVTGFLYLTHN